MPKVLRPIGHEDRLSIVDHLDELRSRLIVCGIALVIAFAACFWQNQVLLKVLNRALPATPATSSNHISGLTADQVKEQKAWSQIAGAADALAASQSQSATDRAHFAQLAQGAEAAAEGAAEGHGQTPPDHDRRRRAVHDDTDGRRRTSRCCSRSRCSSTRRTRS